MSGHREGGMPTGGVGRLESFRVLTLDYLVVTSPLIFIGRTQLDLP
jgi:hypothetical protein